MNEERKQQQIYQILAGSIRKILERESLDFSRLQEIRLRVGKPLLVICENTERILPGEDGVPYLVTKEEIRETMDYISRYSLYAYETELRQGFLTIEGGHRIGVSGKVIVEGNKIKNMQYISSVNIRAAHEVIGCADPVMRYITKNREVCHTLIISPPCCGKTTLIRDMIRQISDGNAYVKGCTVGVVDERSELGGCYLGIAQNDIGMRTDILDCCPKAEGMMMLIRSMSPEVIAVDEIGNYEDINGIEMILNSGCKLLATVHGSSIEDIQKKPLLERMIREHVFERYIILQGEDYQGAGNISRIYDGRGTCLYQKEGTA